MAELTVQTMYFGQTGPANTDRTLELVQERARALGITTVLVATTSGATGLKAAQLLGDLNVVAVTHSAGFSAAYKANHDPDICDGISAAGGQVLTTTHAFGGVGRAVRKKLATYQVDEIIAYTLRCFGQPGLSRVMRRSSPSAVPVRALIPQWSSGPPTPRPFSTCAFWRLSVCRHPAIPG